MSLAQYAKKRNFNLTSEPKASKKQPKDLTTKTSKNLKTKTAKNLKTKKLIFVVQHHFARREHYDFRLQHNGELLSWAVPKGLSMDAKEKRLAVQVENHPIDYAKFSGVIPAGNYGAGTVEILDSGFYTPAFDVDYGLKKGHLKFNLNGKIFKGEFSLVKLDKNNWLIIKAADKFATTTPTSTQANLTPSQFSVQLAMPTKNIPTGKGWAFEIKYDGYRILAFKTNNKIFCLTRNKKDYTAKLGTVVQSLKNIDAQSFVLDGEVVAFNQFGRSDFALLQQCLKTHAPTSFVVFDLLMLNGQDLRALALEKRKVMLKSLTYKVAENLVFSQHVVGKGKQCFNFAKKNNLEGIVAKKLNSVYAGKRNEDWLKIKCRQRQEFVVCGFTTTSKNATLSALVLGYYKNKVLTYVGKVGTGFDAATKQMLRQKLEKLKTKTAHFNFKTAQNLTWVKPQLVAEILFAELTKDNILRQPSFVALRTDKPAKDVGLEV